MEISLEQTEHYDASNTSNDAIVREKNNTQRQVKSNESF